MKNIKFTVHPYSIDINLRKRITEVCGDSATGKSFIYELFNSYKVLNKDTGFLCLDANNINEANILDKLKSIENGVIVIDFANHILNYKNIASFIRKDFRRNNNYILFGRNLSVTSALSELAEPLIEGNNVSIRYSFEE